eukprot:TRINITY_DN36082_c0_g1_i1.p1 TRINITY_DN36082_c0_g1~~TRINITY_DN36082_c0_g1_i1.p1  ORF type:complete len:142 (+),score=63.59 TRINITY_DN36082_c0_g1_i1:60-485(+)
MGCCFSGESEGSGALGKLLGNPRMDVQRVEITTPVLLEVPIDYKCNVKIKLEARRDKARTVEVSWLNASEKKRFEEALESVIAARFTPQNTLSEQYWKTGTNYDKEGEVAVPGMHYLVIRSSSMMSDKNVRVSGRIIKQEL